MAVVTGRGAPASGNEELFERFGVHGLWQRGWTGARVPVGHLDTGVDARHPALRHQPSAFCHFDRAGFPTETSAPFDSAEHGTQTASVICGRRPDGVELGVAPDCALYSGVVLERGDVVSRILCGMARMLECKVRVLCLPLGIPGHTPVFASMTRVLRRHGVLVIAPIGNGGAGRSLSPGDYPGVLSVGAVDRDGSVAPFSGSYHRSCLQACTKPDVLAPGAGIVVAAPGGGYRESAGTSIACAVVAGIAALLMQAAPMAPVSLIEAALATTSQPLPANKVHRCRTGLIRPEAALDHVLANQSRASHPTEACDAGDPVIDTLANRYIDPRFRKMLARASDDSLLEAACVASTAGGLADPRGAAGILIDRVTRAHGEAPRRVRYLAAADVAIVVAKAGYLRALIDDPHLRVASATDIDKLPS